MLPFIRYSVISSDKIIENSIAVECKTKGCIYGGIRGYKLSTVKWAVLYYANLEVPNGLEVQTFRHRPGILASNYAIAH